MKAVEGTANEFTNDSMDEIVLSGDSSGSSDEGAGLRIAQNVKRKNVPADKINVGPEEMQSFCLTIRRVKELETVLVQQSNVHKVPAGTCNVRMLASLLTSQVVLLLDRMHVFRIIRPGRRMNLQVQENLNLQWILLCSNPLFPTASHNR